MPSKRRVTKRVIAFLDVYWEAAGGDCVRAAEMAGFKHPKAAGYKLRQRYSDLLGERKVARRRRLEVDEEESLQALTRIVRDATHRDHLRAIELALRVHGKLSEKIDITMDKRELAKELKAFSARLAQSKLRAVS